MGHLFRQQWTVVNKRTGKRVTKKSAKWYIQYKDREGVWQRKPAFADRVASQVLLMQREQEVAQQCVGMRDTFTDALAKPLLQHIDEFADDLRNRGNSAVHVNSTKSRTLWTCAAGKVLTIADLTPSAVNKAMALVVADKEANGLGLSASTRNHYLTAIKAFAQWLKDNRRIPDNAISGMRRASTEGRATKERRPLSPDEFARLLQAAPTRKQACRVSGADRVALYILAAFTGYRRNELSTITPDSFTFTTDGAFVGITADASKRDRVERIPLQSDVAAYFRKYLEGRPKAKPLWNVANAQTADWLRADMKAAGLSSKEGKVVVDFHSLRQTFVTGLALAGVVPKIAQQLARHSTINLTMNSYAKVNDVHERAAVERLHLPDSLTHPLTHGSTLIRRKRSAMVGNEKPPAKQQPKRGDKEKPPTVPINTTKRATVRKKKK